jgi:E3 ubiquitin-protein ligase RNF144
MGGIFATQDKFAQLREDWSSHADKPVEGMSPEAHQLARMIVTTAIQHSQHNVNLAASNLFTNAVNPVEGCPPILGLVLSGQVSELSGIQKQAAVDLMAAVGNDRLLFLRIVRDELISYANEKMDEKEQKMDHNERVDEKTDLTRKPSNPLLLNEKPTKCEICFDVFQDQGLIILRGCGHAFCKDCLKGYVSAKEGEGVLIICCPLNECKIAISQRELIAIVGTDKFQALDKRALERIILDDQTFHMCATPDCAYIVCWTGGSDGAPWMLCPKCGHERCLKCGREPYHKGKDCKDVQAEIQAKDEKLNKALYKKLNYRICPKCKTPIEKTFGCNKMLCYCGCKFCSECYMITPTCRHVGANHGYLHPKTGAFVRQNQETPDLKH